MKIWFIGCNKKKLKNQTQRNAEPKWQPLQPLVYEYIRAAGSVCSHTVYALARKCYINDGESQREKEKCMNENKISYFRAKKVWNFPKDIKFACCKPTQARRPHRNTLVLLNVAVYVRACLCGVGAIAFVV